MTEALYSFLKRPSLVKYNNDHPRAIVERLHWESFYAVYLPAFLLCVRSEVLPGALSGELDLLSEL